MKQLSDIAVSEAAFLLCYGYDTKNSTLTIINIKYLIKL